MAYARALLKLSGEALMGDQGYGIDPAIVQSIAEDVAKVIAGGTQLAIVVGGGNIFRGLKGSAGRNPLRTMFLGGTGPDDVHWSSDKRNPLVF